MFTKLKQLDNFRAKHKFDKLLVFGRTVTMQPPRLCEAHGVVTNNEYFITSDFCPVFMQNVSSFHDNPIQKRILSLQTEQKIQWPYYLEMVAIWLLNYDFFLQLQI